MRHAARWIEALALGVALLISGCATLGGPAQSEAPADWPARQQALGAIASFGLEGRVSARGPVSGSANLLWNQDGSDYSLRLSGPFGAGAVLIEGTPQQATIRNKDQTLVTRDPEATLRSQLGWTLPVDKLRWWILGLPAPNAPAQTQFDTQARLHNLTQAGWTVSYEEYRAAPVLAPVFDLPRRLGLTQGELTVRVLVDQWEPGP